MKYKRKISVMILTLFIQSCIIVSAATDIVLDGSFADWSDKPSLADPQNDEAARNDITMVKWYPDNDNGNLYLYAERNRNTTADWYFSAYLQGGSEEKIADVYFYAKPKKVDVYLYNSRGRQVWRASGKWARDTSTNTQVEFYIPLSQLVGTTSGGYEIEMYFESGYDYAPDDGVITISSIGTGPILIVSSIIILNLLYLTIKRKCKAEL